MELGFGMKRVLSWSMIWFFGGIMAMEAGPGMERLRDLAADDFRTRETAESDLRAWAEKEPDAARNLFEQHMNHSPDPEMRMRCRSLLKHVVLLEYRKQGEGYVGIQMREEQLGADAGGGFGIRVIAVVADTPAAKAGLKVGDLILRFQGQGWAQADAMFRFGEQIRKHKPGDKVKVKVRRAAEDLEIEVELARRPDLLAENGGFLLGGFGLGEEQADLSKLQAQSEEKYFRKWLAARKQAPEPAAKDGDPDP